MCDKGEGLAKAYVETFHKPFEEATDSTVASVQAQAEPAAQNRAMVETGSPLLFGGGGALHGFPL